MGILKEMFDEGSGDDLGNNREEVLLAKGRYKINTDSNTYQYHHCRHSRCAVSCKQHHY